MNFPTSRKDNLKILDDFIEKYILDYAKLRNFDFGIQNRSDAFKERRDFVVNSLNNIKGISCLKPNGAFYVFPSCKKLLGKKTKLKTDSKFVEKLLEKANVAVVQGSAFGLDGYFRISYATSMKKLKIAMERIKSFCESLS